MKSDEELRWERMQQVLAAEAQGKPVKPMMSKRTLFGIPSTVDRVIDRAVAEDEAARRAERQRKKREQRKSGENGDGSAAE